jgi:two-component system, cell cycle sensor histidine kinase and response regulator CckA
VKSELGGGSAFKIFQPRCAGVLGDSCGGAAGKQRNGSETILLVEDDESVRMIAQRVLIDAGYTVLGAEGGRSALDVCDYHSGPIDLLLTDVIMPRMSGGQVAERIAAIRPDTKVLYMSGYDNDTIAQSGVLEADVTILEKPFTVSGLLDNVRAVLE